jgi:hypothetical protein
MADGGQVVGGRKVHPTRRDLPSQAAGGPAGSQAALHGRAPQSDQDDAQARALYGFRVLATGCIRPRL